MILRCYDPPKGVEKHPAFGEWIRLASSQWVACAWTHLIHQCYFDFNNFDVPLIGEVSNVRAYECDPPDNLYDILEQTVRALDYWEPE